MWFALRYLYLPAVVLCLEQPRGEEVREIRERFHFRRAIDGTRGRKYFNPVTDGSYDSYGSAGGNYEPNQVKSGFSDIRSNVPGEPGVSYPTYTTVPRTSFSCAARNQGYYADEESGCQAFYVCSSGAVASFICPVGSIFSQALLTCDWWNKVNCGMTNNYALSYQQNYDDHTEMVQKAYTMMQPPERNRVENHQQTGARRRVKVKKVKIQPNSVSEFAPADDRRTKNYNDFGSSEPRVVENYPFGGNSFDSNRQSQKDIINVRLQPQNFVVNEREQGSVLNTPAKDSSIIYIQNNENVSPQNTYTQSGQSDFGNNFQNYYGQEEFDFRNQFKPSYAPTVPTVTTTTRRFYSPTVPTPYKLSTISYGDYDQDFEGSRHLYLSNNRGADLLTTPQTIVYENGELENSQNPGDKESDESAKTANEEIQSPINLPELVKFGRRGTNLESDGKRNVENVETENRSDFQLEQEIAKESDSVSVDSINTPAPKERDTVINENKEESNTSNPGLNITPLFAQIPRPVRPSGQKVVDIADQLVFKPFNEKPQSIARFSQLARPSNENSDSVTKAKNVFNVPSQISPFTTRTSESTGSSASALPQTDQNMSGTSDETTSDVSAVPLISSTSQFVAPPRLYSTDNVNRAGILESFTSIPTIPQLWQPVVSSRTQSPEENNDLASSSRMQSLKQTINQSNLDISMIPPLGSLALQIVKLSGMDIVDPLLYTQTFDSVSRIPLLITQDMQPPASSRIRSPRKTINNNNNNNNNISQASPRIPSFISQTQHSSALPKTQSSDVSRDRNPLAILASIPWLTSFRTSQFVRSSETESPSIINHGSNSRALRWIPAFIRQILKRSEPLTSQPSVATRNRKAFDLPAKIPPLIPLAVQSVSPSRVNDPSDINVKIDINKPLVSPQFLETLGIDGASEMDSTDLRISLQTLETSSKIPPLIPQAAQSVSPSRINDLIQINANNDFDIPSEPPPIFQTLPTDQPFVMDSIDTSLDTQTLKPFTRIPPLIPQAAQSASPSRINDLIEMNGDSNIDVASESPLILQTFPTEQPSVMDSGDTPIDTQTHEPSTRIPPLIPQTARPVSSSGVNDPSDFANSNIDIPSESPPIFQIPTTNRPSEADFTDPPIDAQTPESFTGIPQSMFSNPPSIMTPGNESPSVTNDSSTMRPPPRITDLISQFLRPATGSESQVPVTSNDQNALDVSTSIPSQIPQTAQSGSSTGVQDSSEVDVPSESPPISQTFPTNQPSEMDSTNAPLDSQTSGLPTRIPPLIPQTARPVSSSGVNDPSDFANSNIDIPSESPPIFQIPTTNRPSEADFTDPPIDAQTPESFTGIPQSMFSNPPSIMTPGNESPSVTNDSSTMRPPPRITDLISQFLRPATGSESQVPVTSNDQNGLDVSTSIPPQIPQTAQSGSSTGVQDSSEVDVPSESPPISQTFPTDQPSEMDSTNAPLDSQTSGLPTRIPPLIPQTARPVSSSGVNDPTDFANSNIDIPSESPPIFQIPTTNRPSEADFTDPPIDAQTPESLTEIPQSIFSNSPSIMTPGNESPSVINDSSTMRPPPRITDLISQFPQPETAPDSQVPASSTGVQDPSEVDVNNNIDVPFASPSVPQTFPTERPSEMDSTNAPLDPQTPRPPIRIPPLIFSSLSPITPVVMGSPSVTNDDSITRRPPQISSLIPQTTQSSISSESQFSADTNNNFAPNIPTNMILPQTPQSVSSSEGQSPSETNDNSNSDVSAPSPLNPLIPQIIGPARTDPMDTSPIVPQISQAIEPMRTDSTDFATKIPLSIPQVPEPVAPSNLQPMDAVENETNPDGQLFETSTQTPSTINQASIPLSLLGTQFTDTFSQKETSLLPTFDFNYEIQSFNPSISSIPATVVRFRGHYQNPSPFIQFQAPTGLPGQQFVIGSTSDRAVYDFYRGRGSRPGIETKTLRLPMRSEDSTTGDFRINIPDLPFQGDEDPKGTFVRSPLRNNDSPNTNFPKTSSGSSTIVNIDNATPFPKSNHTNLFPFEFPITNHSQLKSFDRPSSASDSFSTKFNDSFSAVNTKNIGTTTPSQPKVSTSKPITLNSDGSRFGVFKQTVSTESKAPTPTPFTSNFDSSRFSSFERIVPSQSKIPTSTPLTHNSDDSRFISFKQTVPTERKAPTSTPFTPNFDSSRFSSFERTVPSQSKIPTSPPFTHNSDENRFGSVKQTVPTEPKTPTSTPFTLNVEGNSYSSFRQTERPIVQKTAPIKSPENYEDLQFTIRGALGRYSTSSASPQQSSPPGRFGYSRELFGSSTPSNIIRTGGLNKLAEDLRETKQGPPKILQTSTLPHELPESLSQFETVPSLNNETPYEIRFTVNADEDFKPSEDFISKILAEHVNNESSGFDGLQGYEIIRSDNPDGSDRRQHVKPTSAPNIQPTVGLVPLPSIAGTNLPGSQRTEQPRLSFHNSNRGILSPQATQDLVRKLGAGYSPYNSNRDIPNRQANRNPVTKVESLNSDVFPRPFFLDNQPNVASQPKIDPRFNDFPNNPSVFDSNTGYIDLRNGLDYSKMRIDPADINGSLKSLFDSPSKIADSPPQHTELILDELKKLFGEPLYRSNSRISFTAPEGVRSMDRQPKQQFANLQQYRVRTDPASGQQQPLTSPKPPTTSTTTTTAAPEPVKTFVETEFIPSLSFSFDYDEGRQQYVEAILQGLLTEDQNSEPLNDDANPDEESNQN